MREQAIFTRIFLVRHGETEWNASGKLMGQSDVALNQKGFAEAKRTADWLVSRKITALYSSDLQRAKQTADIIAEANNLKPKYEVALREIDAGIWTGVLKSQFAVQNTMVWSSWRNGGQAPNNGESYPDLFERAVSFLRKIAKTHLREQIAVVTHSGVIRVILAYILNEGLLALEQQIHVPPGSTTIIDYLPENSLQVECIGISHYLQNAKNDRI